MKYATAAAAVMMLLACSPAPQLIIANVTIVSPNLEAPSPSQTVVVDDGRIVEIRDADLTRDVGPEVIDGSSFYVTPGMMDAHHHVSYVPGMGAIGVSPASDHGDLVQAYVSQQPRSLLYHGVTQILDPSPLTAWDAFVDEHPRPDFFRCGEIPTPGGYPANQMPNGAGDRLHQHRIDPEAGRDVEAVVADIAASGAICVKIYIENGFGEANDWPIFDDNTIGRIRDAAHAAGLPVVAHVNAIDAYQVALRSELDIVAHGLWNWQWPDGDPPVVQTLDEILTQGTGYMPTHMVMDGIAAQMRARTLDDPALNPVVPGALLDWYRAGGSRFFTEELASDFPPDMPHEEIADILGFAVGRVRRATGYLAENGHPIMLASDCPGSPNHANHPGLSTYREILHLAEAGLSPRQILEAATINPARQFGLDHDYGQVAVGRYANLLLLTANPLEDVSAWSAIDRIVLHGQVFERDEFAATE